MHLIRSVSGGIAWLAFCAILAGSVQLKWQYEKAARKVCDVVADNYFLADEPLPRKFARLCVSAAETQAFLPSKERNIRRINERLSYLRSSHLSLYDPDENLQMWQNTGLDTGLRARMIDGEMIVVRVLSGSAGEAAHIAPGDELVTLNGEPVGSEAVVEDGAGLFTVVRAERRREVEIHPTQVSEDLAPTLSDLGGGVGLLRIASFLPQYFPADRWRELALQLKNYSAVIIDLRDNAGGSFPAMLRAFSSFACGPVLAGTLYHQGHFEQRETDLPDDLDARTQMQALKSASYVRLKAYGDYGCFKGHVAVLIDAGTSSTAEIFARAMKDRPQTEVMGNSTAGEVVMARWFQINEFGSDGYELSVPVAGVAATDGNELEGIGVQPSIHLIYDLGSAKRGEDSWVREARKRVTGGEPF